tara:strand:+ start:40626 stop:41708 length:1083 start_codon:yes stop_codon:yes gene_type:complete
MIPISKPFLPPRKDYDLLLRGIWKRKWLTNQGPLANKLEMDLKEFLKVEHLLYVTNGTIAIQLAIQALKLKGDIITTPFTYVATTSSIVWEGCTPVFVDIDENTLTIDPVKIEEAITDKTVAILATHVYGYPCDVEAIQKIADKHRLKVIYDGAHTFGVTVNGKSIFDYGDVSTCSLHATKIYHSGEGGLVITKDEAVYKEIAHSRNFGHDGPEVYFNLGINGKNSEFHAALGLANLKHIEKIKKKYQLLTARYDKNFKDLNAQKPQVLFNTELNYAYYMVIFDSKEQLEKSIDVLKANEIYGRRYFYPSLANCLPYLEAKKFQKTDSIAERVFCFPLYYELSTEEVDMICRLTLSIQKK